MTIRTERKQELTEVSGRIDAKWQKSVFGRVSDKGKEVLYVVHGACRWLIGRLSN